MDFREFRQIFYHLQYQFYLRSERAKRKGKFALLPNGKIGPFLHALVECPEDEHHRWEVIEERPRFVGRKQGSIGPTIRQGKAARRAFANPQDHFPHPSESNRKSVIYRGKRKSVRCRYMLFGWPDGFRSDQISSLYKSIIIYDLVEIYGYKPWQVAQAIFNKEIHKYFDLRVKTTWEIFSGRVFEQIQFLQAESDLNSENFFDTPEESIAQRFLDKLMTSIADGASLSRTDITGDDKHDHTRKISQEVQRYLQRAERLTDLAATGHFREFPSLLKSK